jgi:hypothetical protein
MHHVESTTLGGPTGMGVGCGLEMGVARCSSLTLDLRGAATQREGVGLLPVSPRIMDRTIVEQVQMGMCGLNGNSVKLHVVKNLLGGLIETVEGFGLISVVR